MTIGYYLRDANASTPQRIWAIFRVNEERIKIDTNKKILPSLWSTSKHQALSTFKHSKEYNSYLKGFTDNLEKLVLDLEKKKVRIDKQRIQDEVDKIYKLDKQEITPGEVKDFISFVDGFIASKPFAPSVKSIYKQTRVHLLMAFKLVSKKELDRYNTLGVKEKSKYPLVPERFLDFDQINIEFLERFQDYLYKQTFKTSVDGVEVVQHYKKNYIGKHIKVLKKFIDSAQEKNYVKVFKATSIKAVSEDVDNVYTDYAELQKFANLKLSGIEEQVRDKYILNSFMGFRYSDLNRLQKNDFQKIKIDGVQTLVYSGRNKKTDNRIEFAVHQTAEKIFDKYKFELPVITEQLYNKTIKVIAEKAGLIEPVRIRETRGIEKVFLDIPKYKLISSHTGRRSFCTNLFNDGVATQAIMSISGHKTESEFLKYINKNARVNVSIVAAQVRAIKPIIFSSSF